MLADRAPQVVALFAGRLSRPRVQPPPLPSSPHNNNLSGIAGDSMRRARQPRAKSRNRNFPDGALHDRAGLVALPGQSAGEIIHAAACYGAGKSAPRDADFLANYDRRQATKHTGRRSEISFVR